MSTRKRVHLAPDLSFPIDVATGKLACLGMSGSGKSNALVVLAEELYALGVPFVTFDPKGDWWGIRKAANGRDKGLDVPIFGAVQIRKKFKPKPDLPLEPNAGKFLAELVVRERLSCVLDVAGFDYDTDRSRFLRDFADRLFRLNEEPLHLFLEEVDEYAPQNPGEVDKQTLHVFKRVVKQGRNYGLGISLASQRHAVVNKSVLNMTEIMVAGRTMGDLDKQAIGKWLSTKGQGQDIIEALPDLKDGEVFVIAPKYFKEPKRVQLRRRWTFDSGATPKVGQRRKAVTLSKIDLKRVQEQMHDAIEQAKASDPDELQKRIIVLQRENTALEKKVEDQPVVQAEPVIEHVPVLHEDVALAMDDALDEGMDIADAISTALAGGAQRIEEAVDVLRRNVNDGRKLLEEAKELTAARNQVRPQGQPRREVRGVDAPPERTTGGSSHTGAAASAHDNAAGVGAGGSGNVEPGTRLKKGARAMATLLAAFGGDPLTRTQLGTLCGITKPGTFSEYVNTLKRNGYAVEDTAARQLRATQVCLDEFGGGKRPTQAEVLALWQRKLKAGAERMLDALLLVFPDGYTRAELQRMTGIDKPSTFSEYVNTLKRNGLAVEDGGVVFASSTLIL